MKEIKRRNSEENVDIKVLGIHLGVAYLVTGIFLVILALLVYKLELAEQTVSVCMIAAYAGTTFLAGFLSGKKVKKMKFLWGLLIGIAYFAILVALSLIGGRGAAILGRDFITTFLLCAGGGMLGGMIS